MLAAEPKGSVLDACARARKYAYGRICEPCGVNQNFLRVWSSQPWSRLMTLTVAGGAARAAW
jgi:hypothetical protein